MAVFLGNVLAYPELAAKIILKKTVTKNSELTICYEFPWLIKKQPR